LPLGEMTVDLGQAVLRGERGRTKRLVASGRPVVREAVDQPAMLAFVRRQLFLQRSEPSLRGRMIVKSHVTAVLSPAEVPLRCLQLSSGSVSSPVVAEQQALAHRVVGAWDRLVHHRLRGRARHLSQPLAQYCDAVMQGLPRIAAQMVAHRRLGQGTLLLRSSAMLDRNSGLVDAADTSGVKEVGQSRACRGHGGLHIGASGAGAHTHPNDSCNVDRVLLDHRQLRLSPAPFGSGPAPELAPRRTPSTYTS
jgi:hypothetical protein